MTNKIKSVRARRERMRNNMARYRERLAVQGLVPLSLHAPADDHEAIREYADALIKARLHKIITNNGSD